MVVTVFRPGKVGKVLTVRFFGVAGRDAQARLLWSDAEPARVSLSDASEKAFRRLAGTVDVPARVIVTLWAESSSDS